MDIYFNPRTREGCDGNRLTLINQYILISIHAPVKGATRPVATTIYFVFISIHAPVKGATLQDFDA